jgi:hypothetical protein
VEKVEEEPEERNLSRKARNKKRKHEKKIRHER